VASAKGGREEKKEVVCGQKEERFWPEKSETKTKLNDFYGLENGSG